MGCAGFRHIYIGKNFFQGGIVIVYKEDWELLDVYRDKYYMLAAFRKLKCPSKRLIVGAIYIQPISSGSVFVAAVQHCAHSQAPAYTYGCSATHHVGTIQYS